MTENVHHLKVYTMYIGQSY